MNFNGSVSNGTVKVNEGKVGIYLKYGALMEVTTTPGVHTMAPFVTEVRKVDSGLWSTLNGFRRFEGSGDFGAADDGHAARNRDRHQGQHPDLVQGRAGTAGNE